MRIRREAIARRISPRRSPRRRAARSDDLLQQIRGGAEFHASPAILYADEYSSKARRSVKVAPHTFASKFEAAEYLARVLADVPATSEDVGLRRQLSPIDAKAGADCARTTSTTRATAAGRATGICSPVRTSHSRCVGSTRGYCSTRPVHQHGAFVYDLGFRRDLITDRGLIEAIDLLYWDSRGDDPAGNLRRLTTVALQRDFHYDLYGMRAAELLGLLQPEFDAWKPRAADPPRRLRRDAGARPISPGPPAASPRSSSFTSRSPAGPA